jgi:UDP-N-acetylmuramate dehydrogenase
MNLTKPLRGELHQDMPLAKHTSWHIGGKARQAYKPADLADLSLFLSTLPDTETIIWLGLGSNTLIRDGGIDGTVILTQGALAALEAREDGVLRVEAGITCAKLARFCAKTNLEKGAFFAGIPGTVGGALAMNAGAFGGETWEYVTAVETIDRRGNIQKKSREAFEVGYREVKGAENEWFVAGYFLFPLGDGEKAGRDIKTLLKKRGDTQPIGEFSCGSVFRNPPGDYAARLIESCGLKGKTIGGATVSLKHANFIINQAGATAADMEQLICFVQETVKAQTGVQLIRECHIVGES